MENKKTNSKEWKRLDTISFRGERKVWLRFLSVIKKKDKKNAWEVLSNLIQIYLKREEKK
jgi:flagellar biosynthesis regulator FlaF